MITKDGQVVNKLRMLQCQKCPHFVYKPRDGKKYFCVGHEHTLRFAVPEERLEVYEPRKGLTYSNYGEMVEK